MQDVSSQEVMITYLKNIVKDLRQFRQFQRTVQAPTPWLVPGAVDFLSDAVQPDSRVLEFGGGGSTLWFLQRAGLVVTCEANIEWARSLIKYIRNNSSCAQKWRLWFVNSDWNIDAEGNRWHFKNGLEVLNEAVMSTMESDFVSFPLGDFDIILNDGSVRALALASIIKRIENSPKQIVIVVDNTEKPFRDEYTRALIPSTWPRYDFVNEGPKMCNKIEPNSRTTIWIKPSTLCVTQESLGENFEYP